MKTKKMYSCYKKISSDTLTPIQVYLRVRDSFEKPLLLENSEILNRKHGYSYICLNPLSSIQIEDKIFYIDNEKVDNNQSITDFISNYIKSFSIEKLDFPFTSNGLFGYTGYDTIQYAEDIKLSKSGESIPTLFYAIYQYVLVFDHQYDELYIFSHHTEQETAESNLNSISSHIVNKPANVYDFYTIGTEETEIDDNSFKDMVSTAKKNCLRGDVFQMVLSRKFTQHFNGDEFNVYRALRSINPSPYLFYLDYGSFKLFGSSPESQIIVKDNKLTVHPIAGTVKRSGDDTEDFLSAERLKNDPKENAEHVMLVDLARNDLSKNATGVTVNYYKELHSYSHVIHMVSEVSGELRENHLAYNALLDAFPAGTLSGAPKHKAMQLIHEYETSGRSFYGGSVGYIDFNNQTLHAIIIRSFLSKNNILHYQAGAGIVHSSSEEGELQEVNNKINALRKAIQNANSNNNLKMINKTEDETVANFR